MICIQLKIKCKIILLKTLENRLNKSYFMTYHTLILVIIILHSIILVMTTVMILVIMVMVVLDIQMIILASTSTMLIRLRVLVLVWTLMPMLGLFIPPTIILWFSVIMVLLPFTMPVPRMLVANRILVFISKSLVITC